jgi:DUF917 family protein
VINMKQLTEKHLIAAIWGGAVLGGGGGADPKAGYRLGKAALDEGQVLLASIDELDPEDTVVTASLVGSPKAGGMGPDLDHYVEAFRLLEKVTGTEARAINTNECGGLATVNGWYQASRLGVPIADAPCNGRAHPTGLMGSIGLHKDKSYVSRQAAVGRNARIYVEGGLGEASGMVRALSGTEGLVAVARNPVSAGYLKHNGACGAISMCMDLGMAMADAVQNRLGFDPLVAGCVADVSKFDSEERLSGYLAASAAATFLKGVLLSVGTVGHVDIEVKGGFDIGEVSILSNNSQQVRQEVVRLTFMNEYLTCDVGSHTVFSFPDLISVIDVNTAWPVSSANIREGMEVMVVGTSYENLILGEGMYDRDLYRPLEEAVGRRFEVPKKR